ncbi:polysaccharide deacetylase family protein [Tabrizicola oligotrophica]|uniref:Chitooligosaccharide deacetylase n=1 Tax=Tabrizicola oligotrophica TaxID=2710650 RepID=A0A6M0QXQ1_9RHOB|nr:polysaccharide deacetylase [Tabrizicola oligotrophica]NEY91731.1 polysaccharide deacetylase [Tabrizicola oligotrophica]
MVACALTFDFDAMSVWLGSYAAKNPSMISRGEFGAVAVPRILDLLKGHDLRATFFIPGHTVHAYPDIVRRVVAEGHEVGHHGWVHENPAKFDEAGERANMDRGFEAYASVGARPRGYRSPSWDFSERTMEILLDYGFSYDSSLMGSDFVPYYARVGDRYDTVSPYVFGRNVDVVELPVAWVMDDFPHFEFVDNDTQGLSAPSKVEEIWRDEFTYASQVTPEGLWSITMHPQVIGRGHRMLMLDRLIRHIKANGGVFTTMGNYVDGWRAKNPLAAWAASGAPQAQMACGRRA